MKNFAKTVCDVVFSFGTLIVIFCVAIFTLIALADTRDRQQNQFCYSQNLVRVKTDAGFRCVAPAALVAIK
jgi:lipopolysaccharide/colanic/teichoic acid biosynthesis glycosyltransferase